MQIPIPLVGSNLLLDKPRQTYRQFSSAVNLNQDGSLFMAITSQCVE